MLSLYPGIYHKVGAITLLDGSVRHPARPKTDTALPFSSVDSQETRIPTTASRPVSEENWPLPVVLTYIHPTIAYRDLCFGPTPANFSAGSGSSRFCLHARWCDRSRQPRHAMLDMGPLCHVCFCRSPPQTLQMRIPTMQRCIVLRGTVIFQAFCVFPVSYAVGGIRAQPGGAHMVSGHLQGELLKLLAK